MLESGALGSKRSANLPTNPMGSKRSFSKGAIQRQYRHAVFDADAKHICQDMASLPSVCMPVLFTYCYVEILLVDVAPIGPLILITGNDARFCVTIFFFFPPALFMLWCMASYSVSSILYKLRLKKFRMSMPMPSFAAPALRPTL